MDHSDELIKGILELLTKTHDEEMDYEEVFEVIDQFVDAKVRGEDLSEVMPLILRHLELCRDCLEEYEALLRVIEAEEGLSSMSEA
jgi:hypothetical protein